MNETEELRSKLTAAEEERRTLRAGFARAWLGLQKLTAEADRALNGIDDSDPGAPSDWRPIETAPMDGTEILVCNPFNADGEVVNEEEGWGISVQVAAWWSDSGDGEWTVYCSMVQDPCLHFDPTHWMPLPQPPTGKPEEPR